MENKYNMTFSEYIIQERSEEFYFISLEQMIKCRVTLEKWFSSMYTEYKIKYKIIDYGK